MVQRYVNQVRNHPFIQERPVVKQFVKFSMVGMVNTTTSVTLYIVLTRLADLSPLVANAFAFIVAVTVSFSLNKNWTFRDQRRAFVRQYSSFFFISLVGLGLSELIIYGLHVRYGIHDLIAFFIAVLTVVFWNFFANRLWTFRSHRTDLPM